MLTQTQIANLMHYYLQSTLGANFSPVRMTEVNTPVLAQALQFYHDLCGEALNLTAISSIGESHNQQADNQAILFKMLDASLQTSGKDADYQIKSFDQHQARQQWLTEKSKLDLFSLADLHDNPANLGLAEKFLLGKLHGQEWLSDLDLERLARLCGLKDNLSITRLNPEDIGTVLHFKRRGQSADKPYTVPLILNKGSSGDISSQGSHWVSAMLHVDPVKKEIKVQFRDSMHMSALAQEKIKAELTKAIYYKHSTTDVPPKVYQAFPGFKLNFDMADAAAPLKQADSWSCGYHAFKSVLDLMQPDAVTNTKFTEIRSIPPTEATADRLRSVIYRELLTEVEVPPSAMKDAVIDSNIITFDPTKKHGKINADYLLDYVDQVAKVKPNRAPVKLTPAQLQELKELEENTDKELIKLEELFKPDYAAATKLRLDLAEILPADASLVVAKAKIMALTRMIDKFEKPIVISIKKINSLDDPEKIQYFIKQINNTNATFKLNAKSADHPVGKELELINVRNQFIKFLNIKVEKDEDPWQEIWRSRISNGALYNDSNQGLGELHLYSGSNDRNIRKGINSSVDVMAVRYLQELLKFLSKNQDFFQSTENGFPYKSLGINDTSAGENDEVTMKEMDMISDWCEKEYFFPFESVQISLPELNNESFEKFKRFVIALDNAGVSKITIRMYDKTFQRIAFTNEQYDELIALFKKNNLTVIIANNDLLDEKLIERRMELENVMVINNRKRNIEEGMVRKRKPSTTEAPVVEEEQTKSKNIRPYKLKNFDVRQNLNTEVNVEQQLELQQQHQLQTQLSQEVQQEVQLQEQVQNEIDDSSGAFEGEDLIDFEAYAEDMQLFIGLGMGLANQKCTRYDVGTGILKVFWGEAFGHAPPLPKSIQLVTQSAINKIHATPQFFSYGINMDNLPEGFFVKLFENKFVLCFDEAKFIENKNQSPLTIKLTSSVTPGKEMLIGDQRAFIPDNKETVRRNFDMKDERWTLEKFYDLVRGLNEDPDVDLVGHFKQNYQWYLEGMAEEFYVPNDNNKNITSNTIYPMVEILYSQGYQGLETLLTAMKRLNTKDPELFDNFKRSFITGRSNIDALIKQENLDVMKAMVDMSPVEKKWWRYLVAQHNFHNSPTEPVVLFDGFQHFLKRLREANIPLPFDCPLNNCTNMLMGLDRMIAILGKVNPRNLADQLENLHGLSFREDGAWYAARWSNFHYFHRAMGLSADRLDRKLELTLLRRYPDQVSYKVDYADLLNMAQTVDTSSIDYAYTLFHRYMGTASRINPKYQYYVELINSLKEQPLFKTMGASVLPVLALVTSGERGSETHDPTFFFDAVNQLDEKAAGLGISLLRMVSLEINNWDVTPNLAELTSLYKLLANSSIQILGATKAKSHRTTLKLLGEKNSVAVLEAVKSWDRNTAHIAADDFIVLYESLQTLDADNMDYLAKIAANLRAPLYAADVTKLLELLKQIKAQPSYQEIIKTLASIDTAEGKTSYDKLPSIAELNTVLAGLVNKNDKLEIFQLVALALPDCKFNLASTSNAPPQDFASAMQQSLDDFNAILKEYNIAPLEGDDLQKDIGKHIQLKLKEIEILVVKQHGQMVWNMVKDSRVYPKVMAVAKEAIFASINISTIRFPQLNALREMKFPEPAINNKYDSIGDNIVKLTQYASNINELFTSLLQLRSRWSDFDIDFLLNSPRSNQFSAAQLQRIFNAVNLIDISFIPTSLLASIFADKPFTRGDGQPVDAEQLTKGICQIIELQELNLAQRGRLIDIVTKAKDPSILNELVQVLRKIKEVNPAVMNDCFNILETYYKENSDNRAITTINKLLTLFDKEQEVGKIYFHALSKNLIPFLNTSDLILEDIAPARREEFAKIAAYSCFSQEADAAETLASEDVINKLAEFSKTDGFDQLAKLYQQRPYPRLAKLKQFLDLKNDSAREKFINDFEFDPPGLRAKSANIDSQFDVSTIDERIDSIRDLSRDSKNPLYFTHRKTLKAQLAFVNVIGNKYNLAVPGISNVLNNKVDISDYQKPASKLTKDQIQTLISHYREVISKNDNSWEVEVAKLEFVALAREAMYRTTSKFPYSTQVLSLLNVLMHGGNIMSEIRTGEGKGCITALFAASKWMEGGAVDVCSSNMELAGRDLEEFNDYYEYLGIETKLVRAKTQHSDYKQDGINYSDVSELALFQQQSELLQLPLPNKVSLVLDESDFATLDNTTQFRFATSLDASFDPHFNPHEWLYPIILQFVASPEFNNMFNPMSKVEDIRELKKFVTNHPKLKNAEKFKFYKINDVQLDKWIDSAYTASKLVEGEDFAVRETNVIREGQSIPVQVARVKILHRENPDSSFSNGVHQFLHTRLNLEIDSKKRDGKKFPIEPEKTYLASKSAKNFVDYYTRRGNVLGLTGTVGSEKEVQELRENYGFKFFKIPPHKPLVRVDHAPILAKRQRKGWLWLQRETAKEAHFRTILEQVKQYRGRGQPILLFCDGVASSQELYNFILDKLGPSKLQLYNGEQLSVREKDATDLAGLSEMITITTPMLGRGTDFKPHYANGDTVIEGLAVIPTYISPDRDCGQEIGRAGRNNAFGDTTVVVSEDEFTKQDIKVPTTQAELLSSIETIKEMMTQQNFVQRRERQLFADIKDQFFSQYINNCKMLKANVENFYQQARATGEKETWKPLQHECHLLWEQFLNRIDSQWNELVVGLHNELGKMDETARQAAEEKLLREKITALATFANKEWAETINAMEATSKEKLTTDYTRTLERVEKTTNQIPSPEVKALAIPNIHLTRSVADAFIPLFETINDVMPSSISYKPLDANDFNLELVYRFYTGNDTDKVNDENKDEIKDKIKDEIKATQFLNEINNIYIKVFKKGLPPERLSLAIVVENILRKLLNDYHHAHHNGFSKAQTMDTILRLMLNMAMFGDEKFKGVAYSAYTDHIKDHKKEPDYLFLIANDMYALRNIGALPAEAKLDNKELIGMSDSSVWEDLFEYANKQLDGYSWSLFKSTDRGKTLDKLRAELNAINARSVDASEKISQLVTVLNKVSLNAASTDLFIDKQKGRWSMFSHRNVTGSRFQEMLNRVKDKAMSYGQIMTAPQLQDDKSIDYLRSLLQQLLERTRLVKINNHHIVNKLRADRLLADAIDRMVSKDDAINTQKDLLLISQHLKAYAKSFAKDKSVFQDLSLTAFSQFNDDIIAKIKKYQFAEHVREAALGERKSNFYSTSVVSLRDSLQINVEKLLQSDYVAEKKLSIKKFAEILPGKSEDFQLAQTVLFEMERKLKAIYGDAHKIELVKGKTSYSNGTLIAGFKLTNKNHQVFDLPIVVRSLTKTAGKNDFVFVQVPEFQAQTKAPIKGRQRRTKSLSSLNDKEVSPITTPKKPNKLA